MTPQPALPADLAAELTVRLQETQRRLRLPSLSAAISRRGEPLLTVTAGTAPEPTTDTQYRMGSITKTFTAVLVMQLRDAGRLRLDDTLGDHLPGTPVGGARIRDLLSHLSGLRREPAGPFWEASPGHPAAELLAALDPDDLVLPSRRAWHYSNLAYGLLGLVVERLRECSYADALAEHLLEPLSLSATSYHPREPHAPGWSVHPFADTLAAEPVHDGRAMAPAGQLWSTPLDLCRWGAFLSEPDPAVLDPETAEEMCEPASMRDPTGWTAAHGLGVELYRRGERILAGHGGSMPGYGASLVVDRDSGVAAAVMANAWMGLRGSDLGTQLVLDVLERSPEPPSPWRPVDTVPPEVAELLGIWWWRRGQLVFFCRDGALHMRAETDVDAQQAERFEPAGRDRFRAVNLWDRGEWLRVERDAAGHPAYLDLATTRLSRTLDDPAGGP